MRHLFIILSLTAISTFVCCAQDSLLIAKFDYDGDEFSPKMNAHVRKHRNTLSGYLGTAVVDNETFHQLMDTVCEIGVALIKFKVKKSGIAEIACTKSTSPALAKMFEVAVLRSSRYWEARGNENLFYILPIHYNFRSGCDDAAREKEKMESNYIFSFADGVNIEETSCVILKSWKFMSGVNILLGFLFF